MAFLVPFLMKLISAELTKTVIAYGVNKLLEHADDGITKDVAQVMIDGIAKSKANPTTQEMFADALSVIK